jgi:hypothetical protein
VTEDADPGPEFFRELERRRLRSLVEANLEVARSLHAEDYQLVTPGGATLTRDEYLGQIASGDLRYDVFEPDSEVAVKVLGGGAAVRYVARIIIDFPGGHDDGRFWHTDLYARRGAGWQAVWSHATEIPRPSR